MAKGKQSQPAPARSSAVLLVMLLAATVVAGLAVYAKFTDAARVPEGLRRPTPAAVEPSIRRESESDQGVTVTLPKPILENGTWRFEQSPLRVRPGEDPKLAVVNAFIAASGVEGPAAKALDVDVNDGTARIDFNEAFSAGMGSMDEASLLNGLRACLGQFTDVMRIELYVSGKKVEELGHLDLSDPQVVIRPADWGAKPPSDPATNPPR